MTSRHLGNVNVFVIIVIVPPNVAAVDRVPRQAVAFRLVLGRKEDRREAAAIGEAKEEAPVVVRSKIERILVNLTQTFEPFCFVPIDVSLDARLAFWNQFRVPQCEAAEQQKRSRRDERFVNDQRSTWKKW